MQALCGLQGIFDLFNCKTPGRDCGRAGGVWSFTVKNILIVAYSDNS